MIATAESCTGGAIARALTESGRLQRLVRARFRDLLANEAKIDLLGVSADTLAAAGAVSEAVAGQMADGALTRSRAQLALAVTGIAGPGGATPDKPVGTVCFGWAGIDAAPVTETLAFAGDRSAVRRAAALHALRRAQQLLAGWAGRSDVGSTTNS